MFVTEIGMSFSCSVRHHSCGTDRHDDTLGALLSPVEAVCRRRQLGLLQPVPQVFGVEADVVAEAVVGDATGASLRQQPGVRDAEQFTRGLRVDQRRGSRRRRAASTCRKIRCSRYVSSPPDAAERRRGGPIPSGRDDHSPRSARHRRGGTGATDPPPHIAPMVIG